jgi:hypothetical protein
MVADNIFLLLIILMSPRVDATKVTMTTISIKTTKLYIMSRALQKCIHSYENPLGIPLFAILTRESVKWNLKIYYYFKTKRERNKESNIVLHFPLQILL